MRNIYELFMSAPHSVVVTVNVQPRCARLYVNVVLQIPREKIIFHLSHKKRLGDKNMLSLEILKIMHQRDIIQFIFHFFQDSW